MLERLQKVIAHGGEISRRQAEELIKEGKVFVNGKKITTLGAKVDPSVVTIVVQGKKIQTVLTPSYIGFHKPRKCMPVRHDPLERKTIYDYLPKKIAHLKPVGQFDYEAQGLVVLTNDSQLLQEGASPRSSLKQVYQVKVTPLPSERQLERLRGGITLDARRMLPLEIKVIHENPKSIWLEFVLDEMRNRQIRRMCEKVGLTVKTVIRTQYGPFSLAGIPVGQWRYFTPDSKRGRKRACS